MDTEISSVEEVTEVQGAIDNFASGEDATLLDLADIQQGSSSQHKSSKKGSKKSVKHNPMLSAFRHSQHIMRREGRHVNLKNVMGNSIPSFSFSETTLDSESVGSPLSPDWSSKTVVDITSKFLVSVESTKRRRFQRLGLGFGRDGSLSQSFSEALPASPVLGSSFSAEEELVIYDEDANMGPPVDDPLLLQEPSEAADVTPGLVDLVVDDREKDRADALERKHKMLRLQRSCAKTEHNTTKTLHLPSDTGSTDTHFGAGAVNSDSFSPIYSLRQFRSSNDLSISESHLSTDDISMLRRMNSFEKASQKMIIFSATSQS